MIKRLREYIANSTNGGDRPTVVALLGQEPVYIRGGQVDDFLLFERRLDVDIGHRSIVVRCIRADLVTQYVVEPLVEELGDSETCAGRRETLVELLLEFAQLLHDLGACFRAHDFALGRPLL